jgi:hypothetical protein
LQVSSHATGPATEVADLTVPPNGVRVAIEKVSIEGLAVELVEEPLRVPFRDPVIALNEQPIPIARYHRRVLKARHRLTDLPVERMR